MLCKQTKNAEFNFDVCEVWLGVRFAASADVLILAAILSLKHLPIVNWRTARR